jgi:hypothetical protein
LFFSICDADFVAVLRLFPDAHPGPVCRGDKVRARSMLKWRQKSLGGHFVVYFFLAGEREMTRPREIVRISER